jgi:carbon-monoxide dehydrogenase medium subunit
MKPFSYLEPTGVDDAIRMLGEHAAHAKLLAGGQSLLLELKDRSARPGYLVSLARIGELHGWHIADDGALTIGAGTTYSALSRTKFEAWQGEINAVAGNLACRSVRSMATIGGAAAQADPRYDVPTLLVGLDATMTIASSEGKRTIPATTFFKRTGGTCLAPYDILTEVTFPALSRFTAVAFEKFRIRVFDAAIVSVVAAVKVEPSGTIAAARITIGAVDKSPSLALQCAETLVGQKTSAIDLAALGDAVAEEVLPASTATTRNRQYQRELVRSLTAKSVDRVLAQAGN